MAGPVEEGYAHRFRICVYTYNMGNNSDLELNELFVPTHVSVNKTSGSNVAPSPSTTPTAASSAASSTPGFGAAVASWDTSTTRGTEAPIRGADERGGTTPGGRSSTMSEAFRNHSPLSAHSAGNGGVARNRPSRNGGVLPGVAEGSSGVIGDTSGISIGSNGSSSTKSRSKISSKEIRGDERTTYDNKSYGTYCTYGTGESVNDNMSQNRSSNGSMDALGGVVPSLAWGSCSNDSSGLGGGVSGEMTPASAAAVGSVSCPNMMGGGSSSSSSHFRRGVFGKGGGDYGEKESSTNQNQDAGGENPSYTSAAPPELSSRFSSVSAVSDVNHERRRARPQRRPPPDPDNDFGNNSASGGAHSHITSHGGTHQSQHPGSSPINPYSQLSGQYSHQYPGHHYHGQHHLQPTYFPSSAVSNDCQIFIRKGLHRLGKDRDLVLCALSETQTAMTPFIDKYRTHFAEKYKLDIMEATNARRLHEEKAGGSLWQSITAKVATNINGNLKTLVCASSRLFTVHPKPFFGLCPEHEHIPNPKKAFAGKLLVARGTPVMHPHLAQHFHGHSGPLTGVTGAPSSQNQHMNNAHGTIGGGLPPSNIPQSLGIPGGHPVGSSVIAGGGTIHNPSGAPLPGNLKILCVGAHFPIGNIGKHLQGNDEEKTLEACKYVMARNLRRVLARAMQAKMFDNDTLLLVVGDLNSRTILPSGVDILTETLKDKRYTVAIVHKLIPGRRGNWIDLTSACGTQHWVTYKFNPNAVQRQPVHVEQLLDELHDTRNGAFANAMANGFTDPSYRTHPTNQHISSKGKHGSSKERDLYLDALDDFVANGRKEFHRDKVETGKAQKRFHWPAAADRVLLFQPRGGAVDRIHINQLDILPIGEQVGSDHKPLAVTFDLYVSPVSPCTSEVDSVSSVQGTSPAGTSTPVGRSPRRSVVHPGSGGSGPSSVPGSIPRSSGNGGGSSRRSTVREGCSEEGQEVYGEESIVEDHGKNHGSRSSRVDRNTTSYSTTTAEYSGRGGERDTTNSTFRQTDTGGHTNASSSQPYEYDGSPKERFAGGGGSSGAVGPDHGADDLDHFGGAPWDQQASRAQSLGFALQQGGNVDSSDHSANHSGGGGREVER